jgi:hypothetical protein
MLHFLFVITIDSGLWAIMFCWDDYAICIWFYGFITEMQNGEFVSYFISSWLFFGDQNIVNRIYLCSRFSRRIVQQLQ